jgi:hypothetical protein
MRISLIESRESLSEISEAVNSPLKNPLRFTKTSVHPSESFTIAKVALQISDDLGDSYKCLSLYKEATDFVNTETNLSASSIFTNPFTSPTV